MIFKQLIDYDINEIGTKCLPENLFSSDIGSLQAKYLLQVKLAFYSYNIYLLLQQRLIVA